ncbi:MAG: DNA translocase FtsK 4TM domain-containing protein, partial [Bacilli bacterium]|nr:DNA translocase FtsK 4TM domain-containing protein [Bacilli bacterium]
MAKRKKKKTSNDKSLKFSVEITGLIFILLGIIGLGVFGFVGDFIKKFCIFLFGSYFNVLIAMILVLGIYMLFKRKLPEFFSGRLVGFYLLLFSGLSLAHMNYVDTSIGIGESLSNSCEVFLSVISEHYVGLNQTGGGIIGLFGSWCFVSLLDKVGAYIVYGVIILFGLILLFNVSFTDILDKIQSFVEKQKNKPKNEKKVRETRYEDDYDEEEEEPRGFDTSVELG